MPLRPTTRTLGNVKRAVRRIFGDESSVQINDTDLTNWANEAQTQIVEKNHNLKAVAESPAIPGQAEYTFPDPKIAQVEALLYDGKRLKNVEMPTALNDILGTDPHQDDQGTPTAWYEWAGRFVLYPKPAEPKMIRMYYTKYPEDLTQDSQLLSVPNKYFQAVVDYCLWKAFELDEDWQAANIKENHFRVALEEQAEEERETENITYPIIQEV